MKRFIPLSLVLLVLIAGCGGMIRGKFQSGIRKALPKYIGPAKTYTVRCEGDEGAMLQGKIRHIHIEGEDVQLDRKLNVSSLTIDMDQVRYSTSSRKLKSIKSTEFAAKVAESAINCYVADATDDQYKVKVRFIPDAISVDFVKELMGRDTTITVLGRPEIQDGTKVNFVAEKASAARIPVPRVIVDKILARLNPIVDTSQFKLPVKLSCIKITDGSLELSGNAEFNPDLISSKPNQ